MMLIAAALLLAALQTDFGVRTPPVQPSQDQGARRRATPPKSTFACTVQYVTDGDTFRCSSGTRIRLSSIDTPESRDPVAPDALVLQATLMPPRPPYSASLAGGLFNASPSA